MNRSFRAVLGTAGVFCVALSLGATAPGFAGEIPTGALIGDQTPVSQINAAPAATVPTPPPPVVPPQLTPEGDDATADATDNSDKSSQSGEDSYASLADAVAAQTIPDDMDEELNCLATGIYFESKGEPLSGQLAVADVILNRARSGRFPGSVCSVLTQPGQFSFVRHGRLPKPRTHSRSWRRAVAVAKIAEQKLWNSPVPKALFFHARYVKPHWRLAKVASIGNHIFYR
ncbi:hypothetical protein GCM10023219_18010 [Stakelama sediminis]|uniref:Spore germination cell wall hydrolase CwlJ-like protein n=1 Tax=Stakelama sediminis TaxID=463200 RepID=A0A840Z1Y8_9SPHN|nr:cell wall hydrolase [Stakelama sediminis]MBB5719809.1 spore germination cell wall hydrolase CwlJ-like protein [Stakelama sediminis]